MCFALTHGGDTRRNSFVGDDALGVPLRNFNVAYGYPQNSNDTVGQGLGPADVGRCDFLERQGQALALRVRREFHQNPTEGRRGRRPLRARCECWQNSTAAGATPCPTTPPEMPSNTRCCSRPGPHNRKTPLGAMPQGVFWCRWPDSNRHAVASGGF